MRSLSINYAAGGTEHVHQHRWPQLLYAQSGALRVELDSALWMLPPRRALWVPGGTAHRLRMLGPVALRTLYLREDVAPADWQLRGFMAEGLLHEIILRICELQALDERDGAHMRLCELVQDELLRAAESSVSLAMPQSPRARHLARAFLAVERADIRLSQLCAESGLSRRTAERLFLAETGLSPARWWRLSRLSRALEYLAAGGSVDEAVEIACYRSRSAFSDAFSKTFGLTPGAVSSRR